MRAIVVDHEALGHLAIKEVADPKPSANEAFVKVHAVSLNRGEVRRAVTDPAGARIGWDLAGVVETPAADGSGLTAGVRVVGILRTAAWAEKAAVPTTWLAPLPESVTFAQASTLPVAGLTALNALHRGGNLLGQNVLITGASGGVGHLAVQLAHAAGAHVIGLVRQERHASAVKAAGAAEVVVDETGKELATYAPFDLVLESVGGQVFTAIVPMLARGGTCVLFGASGDQNITFSARDLYGIGNVRIYGFSNFNEPDFEPASKGLGVLAQLIADGRLRPLIDIEAPWTQVGQVAQQLIDRTYPGKAVLNVE